MRFLLQDCQASELTSRCQFLYDVFRVYFIVAGQFDNFIILESFPYTYENDILIIYGHNMYIYNLISTLSGSIHEKNLFIISCAINKNIKRHIYGKQLYRAPLQDMYLLLRNGQEYGFDFDISDAELFLYKSRQSNPLAKLKSIFNIL